MEKSKEGVDRYLAIVGETLQEVIAEHKDFYEKGGAQGTSARDLPVDDESGIEIVSKSQSHGDASHEADQSKPHPEPAKLPPMVETVGASLVPSREEEQKKAVAVVGSRRPNIKSRVFVKDTDNIGVAKKKPEEVNKKSTEANKAPATVVEKKVEVKKPQKIAADPINTNIKDNIDEEAPLSVEARKDPEAKDEEFDYDFGAVSVKKDSPAKAQRSAAEESKDGESELQPLHEKTEPDGEPSSSASPEANLSPTEDKAKLELAKMVKANLAKKPTTIVNSEVILEEGDEAESVVINSKAAEEKSQIEGPKQKAALPVAKLIDEAVSSVKQQEEPKAKDKSPEQQSMLRQMAEEKAKIKMKETKLRDSTMGGVFMNSLATKANTIAQGGTQTQTAAVAEPEKKKETEKAAEEEKKKPEEKKTAAPEVPIKKCELATEDDWDRATKARELELQKDEEEKKQGSAGPLTYDQAWNKLSTQDLSKEIQTIVREDTRYLNVFQKLFAGCMGRFKLDKTLHRERDIVLALMKVKMETDFHSLMVMRVFELLSVHAPPEKDKNWKLIGFQGNNPATDIRGTGMFGVLQVLYFAEQFPELARRAFLLSIDPAQEFPLAIVMFGFTALAAEALREGRLTGMCNRMGSVVDTVNVFYAAAFDRFMKRWEREKLTIYQRDTTEKENRGYCKDNAKRLVDEFLAANKSE